LEKCGVIDLEVAAMVQARNGGKSWIGLAAMRAFVLSLTVFAMSGFGLATEYLSVNDEFGIARDFSEIVMTESEARSARVFVNPVRNVSAAENIELHSFAVGLLSEKVQVVSSKQDANYDLEIVMQQFTNYALRNPAGEPSHGFVLAGICKYPIRDMSRDCESLTYDYFRDYRNNDEILRRYLKLWVEDVFPSSAK
jgi:hypothetical protein